MQERGERVQLGWSVRLRWTGCSIFLRCCIRPKNDALNSDTKMHNNQFCCPQWFFFRYMICLNCPEHILENRAEYHFPYCRFHFGRLACKLPSLEINLDKLFCSGGQRRRTITVGLHFLPQGNFQNNSQVKPRLSCPGCCLFVRKLSFSTFITVDA